MKLSETNVIKSQNLHFMRFIASVMVIYSHSYVLSGTAPNTDFLYRYSKGATSIGGICVALFFLCSGYLISKSVVKADKFIPYIKARLIRLLPPLAFLVVVTVILGAFITNLTFRQYFSSFATYKYLLNGLLLPVHNLPGVFEQNISSSDVNGSLWTLPVEFACYIACFIFYKLKLLHKKRFLYTLPIVLAAIILESRLPQILNFMVKPCVCFYAGMLYYVYREHIVLSIKVLPVAVIMLIGGLSVPWLITPLYAIVWSYILFTVWFSIKQCPSFLGKTGDYSYGIYLWGFLVQQLLVFAWGGVMPRFVNFVLAVAISTVLAIFTFLITERPFIRKKAH